MTEAVEIQTTKKTKTKKKGRWTRRGFIGAGLIAGGALVVGVAIRPGDRTDQLAKYVTGDPQRKITPISRSSESFF